MSNQIVIGAGFGRTGTLRYFLLLSKFLNFHAFYCKIFSTRAALNQLGVGPTYHMLENLRNGHWKYWNDMNAAVPEERIKILKQILKNYKSSIDFPTSIFFEDLLRANPSAKVLLTIRDSPEVKIVIFVSKFW